MGITKLFYLYQKQNKGGKVRGMVLILVYMIAIVLIQLAILDLENCNYGIRIIEQIIQERDYLYNVRMNTPEIDENMWLRMKEFTDELDGIEGVVAAGRYYKTYIIFDEMMENDEFLKANRKILSGTITDDYPALMNVVYIEQPLLPYFSLDKFPEGKNTDAVPAMAGYLYKDYFESGQVYTDAMTGVQYEIVGILPKDCKLPPDFLFHSELYCNIDTAILAVYEDATDPKNTFICNYTNGMYFCSDESRECVERVEKLAQNKNLRIKMATVSEYAREAREDNRTGMELTFLFTVIAVLSGLTAMVSASVIRIILRKQEYGILYANGVSHRDTIKLFAIDHGIKQFMAFGLAVVVTWRYLVLEAVLDLPELLTLFFSQVIWKSLIIVLFLFAGSVLVPVKLLGRLSVSELLGGNEL